MSTAPIQLTCEQLSSFSPMDFLTPHYRQQLQPDVLVICNATAHHGQTARTAKMLLNWVKATQPGDDAAPAEGEGEAKGE